MLTIIKTKPTEYSHTYLDSASLWAIPHHKNISRFLDKE